MLINEGKIPTINSNSNDKIKGWPNSMNKTFKSKEKINTFIS
jgi:hypothetical protein